MSLTVTDLFGFSNVQKVVKRNVRLSQKLVEIKESVLGLLNSILFKSVKAKIELVCYKYTMLNYSLVFLFIYFFFFKDRTGVGSIT